MFIVSCFIFFDLELNVFLFYSQNLLQSLLLCNKKVKNRIIPPAALAAAVAAAVTPAVVAIPAVRTAQAVNQIPVVHPQVCGSFKLSLCL